MSSRSVFCFSSSSSSVRSRIRSSRLLEYCSSIRSIESMMFVLRPLLMLLNYNNRKQVKLLKKIWTIMPFSWVFYGTIFPIPLTTIHLLFMKHSSGAGHCVFRHY